jgi:hypothetical protein
MSYLAISIKEAINNINNHSTDGWFLPAIQRPYVWGSRHENELYICKLFDSILKGYPIGGLILWKTAEEIPFREFITDYSTYEFSRLTDQGMHAKSDKCLVYDGQQRLQTLFSCLRYTFNGKILVFDVLFDPNAEHDADTTGFSFVPKNQAIDPNMIRMNALFAKRIDDAKWDYRKSVIHAVPDMNSSKEDLIESNIDKLWDIFVRTDTKSLAYFPIQSSNSSVVNEVFERLNTGGMALSQADLLFSKIKADAFDFEENLQLFSRKIFDSTGKGYVFGAYSILQVINLLVKGTVRIDPDNVNTTELLRFKETWTNLEQPLLSFFNDYFWGQFKINNQSIIPRQQAMLPIIVYFYEIYRLGFSFKNLSTQNLQTINQFLIKSQINDWNLQSYVDNFSKKIMQIASNSTVVFDFPLNQIEAIIDEKKQRNIEVFEKSFVDYVWFSLKILMPKQTYQFLPDMKGRFNPEIDHIFPKKLADRTAGHEELVDILWNLQPTKGEINGFKTNLHPKVFFLDQAISKAGVVISGSKYVFEYDYLFPKLHDNNIDFSDPVWDDPKLFVEKRRAEMIQFLKTQYGIVLT